MNKLWPISKGSGEVTTRVSTAFQGGADIFQGGKMPPAPPLIETLDVMLFKKHTASLSFEEAVEMHVGVCVHM